MNETLYDMNKRAVKDALEKSDWNYNEAAKLLGKTRAGAHFLARKYGFIKLKTVKQKRWVRV